MGVKVTIGDPSLGFCFDEEPAEGTSELEAFFAIGGPLAQSLPGYKPRSGQIAYARQIEACIADSRHLLEEAPCGTGKSVAYLTPALLHTTTYPSGEQRPKIVIVTANIALQEQLVSKDLPMLREIFQREYGRDFSFALLKGHNNYLCPAQYEASMMDGSIASFKDERYDQAQHIYQWAGRSEKGDRSELPFEPYHDVWRQFAIQAVECPKRLCPYAKRGECPAIRSRLRAQVVDVVVTNYHMLAAHINSPGGILATDGILILDEAHECADIMRDALGGTVAAGNLYKIVKLVDASCGLRDERRREVESLISDTFTLLDDFRKSSGYSDYVRAPVATVPLAQLLPFLDNFGVAVQSILEDPPNTHGKRVLTSASRARGRLQQAVPSLRALLDLNDAFVLALEETKSKTTMIKSFMLEPAKLLTGALFRTWSTVVATSATVTASGSFGWIRNEIGSPKADTREMEVESPFDFQKQGLLVIPEGVPLDTNSDAFRDSIKGLARRTVSASKGGCLMLFTSYRNMNIAYEGLMGLPYRILKQGDMPRNELVQRFRDDGDSILLGVASLWTGIDVPGDSLRCLFIDKMPFPMRSDPVACAIMDRDDNWFRNMSLPRATISLKQGVGRLIRSVSDRGACVIVDPRLSAKRYGSGVIKSLPDMLRSSSIEDVKDFLATGMVGDDLIPF